MEIHPRSEPHPLAGSAPVLLAILACASLCPGDPPSAPDAPDSGRRSYAERCAGCHGADGRDAGAPAAYIPALNRTETLACAEDDYYRVRLHRGHGAGTVSREEVDRIVGVIRGWEAPGARREDILAHPGSAVRGRRLYRGLCAACHGRTGEGGLGSRLNSRSFLAVVTDEFLAEVIVNGRPGTAMVSWKRLPATDVADLIAFVRSWQPVPPSLEAVAAARAGLSTAELTAAGKRAFGEKCAACHGTDGAGGLGPRLASADLSCRDEQALYDIVTGGRRSAGMPAWPDLAAPDLAGLIAVLRSWSIQAPAGGRPLEPAAAAGDPLAGKEVFESTCAECHGSDGNETRTAQLSNPRFLRTASDAFLAATIVLGRTDTDMPALVEPGGATVDAKQVRDVIAYLRQWRDPEAWRPPARGVDLTAKAISAGQEHFARYCRSCHGDRGRGTRDGAAFYAPALNDPDFLAAASDGFLLATITRGRIGTPMRPFGQGTQGVADLEPSVLAELVAYIRSWQQEEAGK